MWKELQDITQDKRQENEEKDEACKHCQKDVGHLQMK